jgi:hypothetical protein
MTEFWNRLPARRTIGLLVLLAIVSSFAWAGQQSPADAIKLGVRRDIDPHAEFVNFREDWNTLTLANSNLQPQKPVLGENDDTPGKPFIRQRFQLYWRPGDPLDVYVIRPRGVKKPPVILYLYSYPQDINRFDDDAWASSVTAGRFAAVGFVSAMTGHRTEYRPLKESFVSEFQEALATSVHDVQMVLNYLAKRGDVDMDRVGMFGQGSGATISILASAADPRIKAVDALAPWADWPEWMAKTSIVPDDQRSTYSTPEFLARVAQLDPLIWLPKMKAQSFRMEDVRKDPAMPDASQEKMEAAAPEFAEINQFGDRTALFPMVQGGKIFTWLQGKLDPNAAPAQALAKSERVHFYPPKAQAEVHTIGNPLPMSAGSNSPSKAEAHSTDNPLPMPAVSSSGK